LPVLLSYEDKLLLKEVSAGNELAFRALYDAYFNHLAAYIFKLCKSKAITEEIVQEIFVKLWVNRALLTDIAILDAYIFTMARNKTIDHLRRLAKETRLISVLSAQLPEYDNNIEERLNATALQLLIEEALEPLSPQKKQIFHLSRNEGLTHDEIAEIMQLSKSTVKNHLSETLKHVRDHISQQPNPGALLLLWAFISGN
jgi:RNA polymerase sigma-70 factor (ECF subfamily)